MHLFELHLHQPLASLVSNFPILMRTENTDTLSCIGSCITKEEHSYKCGNLINNNLIAYSKSLHYICMSTDTFNTPKEGGGLLKIHDCCHSLSFFLCFYTEQNTQKNTSSAFMSCLTWSISCQCYAVLATRFQQPCKPHVHSCSASLKFCLI